MYALQKNWSKNVLVLLKSLYFLFEMKFLILWPLMYHQPLHLLVSFLNTKKFSFQKIYEYKIWNLIYLIYVLVYHIQKLGCFWNPALSNFFYFLWMRIHTARYAQKTKFCKISKKCTLVPFWISFLHIITLLSWWSVWLGMWYSKCSQWRRRGKKKFSRKWTTCR